MSKRSSSQWPLLKNMSFDSLHKVSPKASTRLFLTVIAVIVLLVSSGTGQCVFAGPIEDCREHVQYGVPSKDPILLFSELKKDVKDSLETIQPEMWR